MKNNKLKFILSIFVGAVIVLSINRLDKLNDSKSQQNDFLEVIRTQEIFGRSIDYTDSIYGEDVKIDSAIAHKMGIFPTSTNIVLKTNENNDIEFVEAKNIWGGKILIDIDSKSGLRVTQTGVVNASDCSIFVKHNKEVGWTHYNISSDKVDSITTDYLYSSSDSFNNIDVLCSIEGEKKVQLSYEKNKF